MLFSFDDFYIYFYIIREPSDQLNKYSLAVGYELRKKFGELVGESMNYQCPTGCPMSEEEENQYQKIQIRNWPENCKACYRREHTTF